MLDLVIICAERYVLFFSYIGFHSILKQYADIEYKGESIASRVFLFLIVFEILKGKRRNNTKRTNATKWDFKDDVKLSRIFQGYCVFRCFAPYHMAHFWVDIIFC